MVVVGEWLKWREKGGEEKKGDWRMKIVDGGEKERNIEGGENEKVEEKVRILKNEKIEGIVEIKSGMLGGIKKGKGDVGGRMEKWKKIKRGENLGKLENLENVEGGKE